MLINSYFQQQALSKNSILLNKFPLYNVYYTNVQCTIFSTVHRASFVSTHFDEVVADNAAFYCLIDINSEVPAYALFSVSSALYIAHVIHDKYYHVQRVQYVEHRPPWVFASSIINGFYSSSLEILICDCLANYFI